jgi:hypothetical protein
MTVAVPLPVLPVPVVLHRLPCASLQAAGPLKRQYLLYYPLRELIKMWGRFLEALRSGGGDLKLAAPPTPSPHQRPPAWRLPPTRSRPASSCCLHFRNSFSQVPAPWPTQQPKVRANMACGSRLASPQARPCAHRGPAISTSAWRARAPTPWLQWPLEGAPRLPGAQSLVPSGAAVPRRRAVSPAGPARRPQLQPLSLASRASSISSP